MCLSICPFHWQISDAHIDIRVYAPYGASHGSQVSLHERASTIDLQLSYDTIRFEVGDPETRPTEKAIPQCSSVSLINTKAYRPWQSWAVLPHVEESKSQGCPFQLLPGLSQKAPRLQNVEIRLSFGTRYNIRVRASIAYIGCHMVRVRERGSHA
jgi:hypothetical protein